MVTPEDKNNVLRGLKLYELTSGGKTLDLEELHTYVIFMHTLTKLDMVHRMQVNNALRHIRNKDI